MAATPAVRRRFGAAQQLRAPRSPPTEQHNFEATEASSLGRARRHSAATLPCHVNLGTRAHRPPSRDLPLPWPSKAGRKREPFARRLLSFNRSPFFLLVCVFPSLFFHSCSFFLARGFSGFGCALLAGSLYLDFSHCAVAAASRIPAPRSALGRQQGAPLPRFDRPPTKPLSDIFPIRDILHALQLHVEKHGMRAHCCDYV